MSPKVPRDVSGKKLVKVLTKFGYQVIRQSGSHIRMAITLRDTVNNISVPNHDPIKLGTLMSIVSDVAEHLGINKEDIISRL